MSFIFYDLIFLAIFCLILVIFFVSRRKNLKREGIIILYRTQIGVKIIDYISKKCDKVLKPMRYALIFVGYLLMGVMLFLLFQLVYLFLKNPDFIRAVKIPPIVPLIPYLPSIFKADYLPPFYFTYWIIVLAIAGIVHEFFHGIFFRKENIKIKSTGFAFLGPFIAFFVEPDEKKMNNVKAEKQLSAIAAGSFSNLIVALLFFLVLWGFFSLAFVPSGVSFSTYSFSVINSSQIEKITNESFFIDFDGGLNLTKIIANEKVYYTNQQKVENSSLLLVFDDAPALKAGLAGIITEFDNIKIRNSLDLKNALMKKNPDNEVLIKTLKDGAILNFKIKLVSRPDNKSQAYLGIVSLNTFVKTGILQKIRSKLAFFKDPDTYYKPRAMDELTLFIYNLIWWIALINLSVALGNMLPLGIFDGGRFFYLTILWITKSEKIAKKSYKFSTLLLIFIFLALTLLWVLSLR